MSLNNEERKAVVGLEYEKALKTFSQVIYHAALML